MKKTVFLLLCFLCFSTTLLQYSSHQPQQLSALASFFFSSFRWGLFWLFFYFFNFCVFLLFSFFSLLSCFLLFFSSFVVKFSFVFAFLFVCLGSVLSLFVLSYLYEGKIQSL